MKSKLSVLAALVSVSAAAQWSGNTFTGSSIQFQPVTSGGYFLINFNSNVNSGSDKGLMKSYSILFCEATAKCVPCVRLSLSPVDRNEVKVGNLIKPASTGSA